MRFPRSSSVVAMVVLASLLVTVGNGSVAGARPGDRGHEGIAYVEAVNPTASKPQSKLWFNDGLWWGVMAKPQQA